MGRSGEAEKEKKVSEQDLVLYSEGWRNLLHCQILEWWDDMQSIVVGWGLCPNNSEVEVQ